MHVYILIYIYIENVNPFHIAQSDSNQLHVHQGKKITENFIPPFNNTRYEFYLLWALCEQIIVFKGLQPCFIYLVCSL